MGSVSYYWKIVRSDSIELDFKDTFFVFVNLINQGGMSVYEVPFVYWEWEEEITKLELENFGLGEFILMKTTNSTQDKIRAQFSMLSFLNPDSLQQPQYSSNH